MSDNEKLHFYGKTDQQPPELLAVEARALAIVFLSTVKMFVSAKSFIFQR